MCLFKVKYKSQKSAARVAELKTQHASLQTPFFMPVATVGAVKTLSSQDLKALGAQIILGNTYHLFLRPGMNLIKKAGGLHKFMNWGGPILTDSGGFQVYSLSKIRKITNLGVTFRSHLNGQEFKLTPQKALKIQQIIGSDIAMVLDECVGYPAAREQIEMSAKRTTLWAEKLVKSRKQKIKKTISCYKLRERAAGERANYARSEATSLLREATPSSAEGEPSKLLFAINQGGIYKDLRLKSARELVSFNFDGYAIGGLAVGEPWPKALKVLDWVVPELPKDKPRYLMGVGYPEQIIEAVRRGVDMFDCVIPTREARHGKLYLWHPRVIASEGAKRLSAAISLTPSGPSKFYKTVNILNSEFSRDLTSISKNSKIPELREYSKAYLHHLFKIKESLAQHLATLNNVEFYLDLMEKIRGQIKQGKL